MSAPGFVMALRAYDDEFVVPEGSPQPRPIERIPPSMRIAT